MYKLLTTTAVFFLTFSFAFAQQPTSAAKTIQDALVQKERMSQHSIVKNIEFTKGGCMESRLQVGVDTTLKTNGK